MEDVGEELEEEEEEEEEEGREGIARYDLMIRG